MFITRFGHLVCNEMVAAVLAVALVSCDTRTLRAADDPVSFERDVQPVLNSHCVTCHGEKQRKSELNLASANSLFRGGESGKSVVPGEPEDSPLFTRVRAGEMPPAGKRPLTPQQIELIRLWISQGAKARLDESSSEKVTQHRIIPLMLLRCTACHGAQRQEADLDLRTKAAMLKGGKSGPAVVPGKPDESPLIKRIKAEEMPPRRKLVTVSVKPMEVDELKLLERWIADGLPESAVEPDVATTEPDPLVSDDERRFWSFQPPRAAPIPDVSSMERVRNPIDAFVLRKLEASGLDLSPTADRAILFRRLCFDLVGLPPDPEDVEAFVADAAPDAWERAVNRLLACPSHGERWGRYWLDAAGYADSEGAQNEDRVRAHMWRYRDYVIRSINADKSYDRFLHEQLAGDELADYEQAETITDEIYDNLVATGFLRTVPDRTFAGITNFVPDRLEVIADEMQIFGSAVLGLTVHCARCHSHKFDPIPQRDYYRLLATFKDAFDEHDWLKPRTLRKVTTPERRQWEVHTAQLQQQIGALQNERRQLEEGEQQKRLDEQIKAIEEQKQPEPGIRALWSQGRPAPTYLLSRGNYLTPGREVGPGIPSVLTDGQTPFAYSPPWPGAKQTGRRLALARWLTEPDHPLTARVMVNRVWKHHFGIGLVQTLDNFGTAGEAPSHPELLDYLAVEFVRREWSMKAIHRMMLSSSTWRQTSRATEETSRIDPDGRMLSRMPLRRMEAEVVRDSVLQLAGRLNVTPFGSPDDVETSPQGLVTARPGERGWRRSIYVLQRRTQIPTLLESFDYPQMGPNCVQRNEAIVAPQALHLMNNSMVHDLAQSFAQRVWQEAGTDPLRQIDRAWRMAVSRPPTEQDLKIATTMLADLTREWETQIQAGLVANKTPGDAPLFALGNLCHALFNSAAFLYID